MAEVEPQRTPLIVQSKWDTPKTVEDKVRGLPANQGLNDRAMWAKIDAEVANSRSMNMLLENEVYVPHNKHGA